MACKRSTIAALLALLLLAGCGSEAGDPLEQRSLHQTLTGPEVHVPGAPLFGVSGGAWAALATHPAEKVADAVEAAGGKVLRVEVPWYSVEPQPPAPGSPGVFTFSQYDAIKAAMKRHHIRPLIVFLGTPHWALPQPWGCPGPGNCDGGPAPDHLTDLAAFTRALVKAFPTAIAIQPYNEVNNALNWGPVPVDVKRYAQVLSIVHRAVRETGSKVPVITSGLVNYPQGHPGDMDAPDFLRALYAAGAKGTFEGIGVHAYGSDGKPDAPDGMWLHRITAARDVARAAGDAGRPLWITESGYPTGGPAGWTVVVSEHDQSRLERCQYQLLVPSPDIKVVLHNFVYDFASPRSDKTLEDHWGLLRENGDPKPIVGDMAQMLRNPEQVTSCSQVR